MGLFTQNHIQPDYGERYQIWEAHGAVEIDKEFRDLGVSEGWLTLVNQYRDAYGVAVFDYKHSHPP